MGDSANFSKINKIIAKRFLVSFKTFGNILEVLSLNNCHFSRNGDFISIQVNPSCQFFGYLADLDHSLADLMVHVHTKRLFNGKNSKKKLLQVNNKNLLPIKQICDKKISSKNVCKPKIMHIQKKCAIGLEKCL